MDSLHQHVEELLASLLVDPASVVKRAAISDTAALCVFFGRQKTNDLLLSHMITYLNDRDWQLRHDFFTSVIDVATCLGGQSLEEYILPLMVQALAGLSNVHILQCHANAYIQILRKLWLQKSFPL